MTTDFTNMAKNFAAGAKTFVRTIGRVMSAVPPRSMPSNCVNINALLLHLCDFDQATYRYIIKWLAYPLQNPGAKMQYALVVNGERGTGKRLFFDRVVRALHGDGAKVIDTNRLKAEFNDWASGARYVVVDGALSAPTLAKLKAIVSSDSTRIIQKAKPMRIETNRMNIVFMSGSSDFLPLHACDRRFMAIEAPPKRERLFYAAVADEIENGGAAAFRDYLVRAVDLTDFNQFSEPPTLSSRARMEYL